MHLGTSLHPNSPEDFSNTGEWALMLGSEFGQQFLALNPVNNGGGRRLKTGKERKNPR